VNGRYLLAFGARRLRASRLAEMPDIPAVIRPAGPGDFAEQLVENQQRADLSNSDLAAAIARLVGEGASTKDIAALCALKDYQVAAFRQAGNFPPELACRLDTSDMRALYDLYRQWGKTPREVVNALPEPGVFISVTEARRIIGAITGKPTGSIVLERARAEAFQERGQTLPGGEPETAPQCASLRRKNRSPPSRSLRRHRTCRCRPSPKRPRALSRRLGPARPCSLSLQATGAPAGWWWTSGPEGQAWCSWPTQLALKRCRPRSCGLCALTESNELSALNRFKGPVGAPFEQGNDE
jgi:ParB family chromosome partitioning protein